MNSNRPYLIRAMHEWLTDNNEVPYVIVDVDNANTLVPEGFAKDGQIVLNISYAAAHNLMLGNELISFSARFNGVTEDISFPPKAVLGIFARDTGKGMMFEPAEAKEPESASNSKKTKLKLVKKPEA